MSTEIIAQRDSWRFAIILSVLFVAAGLVESDCAFALIVTAPPAGSSTVQASTDFATQVVGDAWDMNNPQDVDTDESANLNAQTFSGGVFSATCTVPANSSASFWPQFTGYGSNIVATKRGPRYPIDTSVYRYFTIKLKASTTQQDRVLFFKNGDTSVTGNYGSGIFQSLPANQWAIQTWDLYTDVYTTSPYFPWTSFAQVQGIRVDPCTAGSATIQVDWIRLTAAPSAGQSYTVTWSDTVNSTYTITAVDADGARYQFATGVSGTSYVADFSRLAPGDYHVEVKRADLTTATSSGVIHVNTPPQVQITAPTRRGEQSQSYAIQQQGAQWGPLSPASFAAVNNFTNVSYTNPVGSFYGRPTSNDTQFIMQTAGHPIDALKYRSACFTLEVFGPRSVANGSIARLLWGVTASSVSTTTDIVLGTGLVEYCMPDLADTAAVPLVSGSPQPWSGSLGYLRLDPDELTPTPGCNTPQTCYDVRLDSVYLAPFALANPGYAFKWTLTDPDNASDTVDVYLDPDTTPLNGNEIHLGSTTVASGNGQFAWTGSCANTLTYGPWHVLMVASDGINPVSQYAGGPLLVGRYDGIFRNGFESIPATCP